MQYYDVTDIVGFGPLIDLVRVLISEAYDKVVHHKIKQRNQLLMF